MVNTSISSAVKTNTSFETCEFTIAKNANIFDLLSSRIYEMPEKAIVREICSNAIDANIKAGKTGGILVNLPNSSNPEFSCQDYGSGMNDNEIIEVYTQYGNSTKTEDNSQIGGFGIGAKTPFTYTDQFTIESCKNGTKNTYLAFKDESGIPKISKVMSEPSESSGTRISFAVKKADFEKFVKAAFEVFFFSKELPEFTESSKNYFIKSWNVINGSALQIASMEDFDCLRKKYANEVVMPEFLFLKKDAYYIEMGGVIYNIDYENIFKPSYSAEYSSLFKCKRNAIVLHAPIGSVPVQASREKLHYTKNCVESLRKMFIDYLVKRVNQLERELDSNNSLSNAVNAFNNINLEAVERFLQHNEIKLEF